MVGILSVGTQIPALSSEWLAFFIVALKITTKQRDLDNLSRVSHRIYAYVTRLTALRSSMIGLQKAKNASP